MAIIIKSDGTEEPLVLEKHTSLKTLQTAVGGYIEMLHTTDGRYLICNEEGKLNNLPLNRKATNMRAGRSGDFIVGNVVICDKAEMDDEDEE